MRALALGGLLLVAATAAAAPPREAKLHFDRGSAAYGAGRWQEAVDEFTRAYELSRYADILLDIARAETHLGREEAAIGYLERYLAAKPDAEDAPSVRAEVTARRMALIQKKNAAEAQAEAERARRAAEEAEARRADEKRREAAAHRLRLRWAGVGLVVAGAAIAGGGVACGLVAQSASDEVMNGGGPFNPQFVELEKRGNLLAPLGIALDVVGAAVAITGAALIGLSFRAPAEAPRAWLAPTGSGLALGGVF